MFLAAGTHSTGSYKSSDQVYSTCIAEVRVVLRSARVVRSGVLELVIPCSCLCDSFCAMTPSHHVIC